ncbi:hypothetical protein JW851_02030, partial [Candidatus Woesearchaeota archaeon]|nr:hypothetical protein [Candidatus Woesearchaeota archaeon]
MNSTLKIEKKYADSITNLALDTLKNNKQALIFVNTKRSAEKCAEEISKKLKDSPKWLIELSNLSLKAVSKPTKQCKRLSTCLEKGIAFHHASLHSKQKELIESNFRKGNIKIICCTPTLAAGLDLPAFRAIIRDVKRYTGRGMQNIPVLEYLQMAGRCVSEDTVVFTEKGYPIKVSEIVRKYFKEKEIGTKKIKNFKILSVNLKTNKPTLSEVKIVWKRKIKKMLEIETKSGKIIKVSEDHPLLTFTKINCGKARISKTLEDKEGLYNEVMKLREKYGWGENKISRYLGIFEKRNLIKHWFSGKTKPQKKVFSWKKANQVKRFNCYAKTDYLASLVNFDDFNEIIAPRKYLPKEKIIQIDKNTFLTKQGHTKCDFPEKWSEDLCRFIAKIMSDGSIYYNKKDNSYQIRYFNKNRSIQNEYVNMCLNLFNKKAQVKWRRGSYEARFKAYLIGKFLENIGVPAGKKSFILKMPNPIFALPKKMIKSFFLEYVRCDGWEKPESYTIITSSKKLAYDFALLLSKIGYLARIQKKKPNNWRKKEIWETSVSKSQFNETKKKNCVGNIFPDLIKSIKVINKEQYVYDFTLDKEHNFVANGLIIHNSGRPNWDSEGQAILIASSDSEKDALTEKYVCGEPEDIFSKLAVEPVLRTYLLSLIATKVIQTKQQILDFFEKTFWAFQF